MKKYIACILTIICMFCLIACGSENNENQVASTQSENERIAIDEKNSEVLKSSLITMLSDETCYNAVFNIIKDGDGIFEIVNSDTILLNGNKVPESVRSEILEDCGGKIPSAVSDKYTKQGGFKYKITTRGQIVDLNK